MRVARQVITPEQCEHDWGSVEERDSALDGRGGTLPPERLIEVGGSVEIIDTQGHQADV